MSCEGWRTPLSVATLRRFPPGALPAFEEAPQNAARDDDEQVLRSRIEVTWGVRATGLELSMAARNEAATR